MRWIKRSSKLHFKGELKLKNIEVPVDIVRLLQQPSFLQPHDPESSIPSTSINSLINAERIPSEQALGLNPQEASILNFLRVDAAEKQRDRR